MDPRKQRLTTVTAALTLGQTAAAVQALGAFRQFQIVWREPVLSLLDAISLLALDIKVIRVECALETDNPVNNYVLRLLVYPFFALLLTSFLLLLKANGHPIDRDRILNSQGLTVLIAYISLVLSAVLPLQCVPNPNGTSSMASNPGVVCWESDPHTTLALLSIIGILMYPVTMLSLVIYITVRQPTLIGLGQGLMLARRYRWLFQRFTPECFYYGVIYIAAKLSPAEVFLDSDQLEEEFDLIFDTVRCSTQNLVILLTAETMHRRWRAGEIVTAVACKIPIVPGAGDDYMPPDEPALALLHQVWSEEQKHTLGTYGIDVPMIQGAYRTIKEPQALSSKRLRYASQQVCVCVSVSGTCGARKDCAGNPPPLEVGTLRHSRLQNTTPRSCTRTVWIL